MQNFLLSLHVHLAKLTEPVKIWEFNFYILCEKSSYCLQFSFMQ